MSEKALIYSKESFIHRFIVLYEAAALNSEFTSYLLRSLLSEGRLRYPTVERTAEGLRQRTIEKEGPTGLIVTTTAVSLHSENETRAFSITITDTQEQTKHIMVQIAKKYNGQSQAVSMRRWHDLQAWLQRGRRGVIIPYAVPLAEATAPVAVRLRRDISAVLTLISAHALLHQAKRKRAKGQIIATFEDYAVVRDIVADFLTDGLETTVSPTIRETVTAVGRLNAPGGVSVANLAKALRLDKGTVSRRVREAIARGYLKNLEDKNGVDARLVIGDPLPKDQQILPTVEALKDRCSVAGSKGEIQSYSQTLHNDAGQTSAQRDAAVTSSEPVREAFAR
jgi:hypothetical protein